VVLRNRAHLGRGASGDGGQVLESQSRSRLSCREVGHRHNAVPFNCRRSSWKARGSALCSCNSSTRTAMATLTVAPDGCNG
jgi:hypothetical protein